jgi:hypothetical protein
MLRAAAVLVFVSGCGDSNRIGHAARVPGLDHDEVTMYVHSSIAQQAPNPLCQSASLR